MYIWETVLWNNMWIKAAHIAGKDNVLADDLSRGRKNGFTVPAFPHDQKICVVRAMKYYLRLTEDRRGTNNPKALLRSMVKPFGPPLPQTISNWKVRTIHMAYDIAKKQTTGRVRAHSTRSLGPSWAGIKGASLAQILDAADWRRKSTFCRFYLRDMSSEQTAFGRAVLSAADVPEPKL